MSVYLIKARNRSSCVHRSSQAPLALTTTSQPRPAARSRPGLRSFCPPVPASHPLRRPRDRGRIPLSAPEPGGGEAQERRLHSPLVGGRHGLTKGHPGPKAFGTLRPEWKTLEKQPNMPLTPPVCLLVLITAFTGG